MRTLLLVHHLCNELLLLKTTILNLMAGRMAQDTKKLLDLHKL